MFLLLNEKKTKPIYKYEKTHNKSYKSNNDILIKKFNKYMYWT